MDFERYLTSQSLVLDVSLLREIVRAYDHKSGDFSGKANTSPANSSEKCLLEDASEETLGRSILRAVFKCVSCQVYPDAIVVHGDGDISYRVIEDNDGCYDQNGEYQVDYVFSVTINNIPINQDDLREAFGKL